MVPFVVHAVVPLVVDVVGPLVVHAVVPLVVDVVEPLVVHIVVDDQCNSLIIIIILNKVNICVSFKITKCTRNFNLHEKCNDQREAF